MPTLSSFVEAGRFGRLYTGGKVHAHGSFVICPCGVDVHAIDVTTGKVVFEVSADADEFTSFAVRADGRQLVTAGRSRQLRSWSLVLDAASDATCTFNHVWKAHKMPVMDLTYDPTGTLVASASSDSSAMVFDVDRAACTHVFRGHNGPLHLVAFHPDPKKLKLLTAGADNLIKVWDLNTRACVGSLSSHVGLPTSLAFSPDGTTLLSAGRDQLVNLWRWRDLSLSSSITVLEPLESVAVVEAEAAQLHFVTAGENGLLRRWDAKSGKCLRRQLPASSASAAGGAAKEDTRPGLTHLLSFGPGTLLAITTDHNLVLHDASTLQPTRCLAGNNDEITDLKCIAPPAGAIAASPAVGASAAAKVAVATNSEQVKLFETSGMSCQLLFGHSDVVLSLDVSADGLWLASASKDCTARIWRTSDGACVGSCEGHVEAVGAVAFARRSPWILTGSKDKTTKLWDTSGLSVHPASRAKPGSKAAAAAAAAASGAVAAEGAAAEKRKARARSTVLGHAKEVNALAVAPNDKFVASASQDRTIKVWAVRDGALEEAGVLKGHKRAVWCVAFSPVDRACASGSGDMTLKVWSMVDFSCLRTLEGHTSSVLRVHWVSEGLQLLTSGSDGLVKLWSAKASECVCTLDGHEDKVWALDVARPEGASSSAEHADAEADGDDSGSGTALLEVWSGSADSVLVRWRDSSEEVQAEKDSARELQMQQEQDLAIALHAHEYENALKLALRLRQPRALRGVLEKLLPMEDGEAHLREAVARMETDELAHCMQCARDWNTTAAHSLTAQKLLHALLRAIPRATLLAAPPLKELLEALIPYTERHFERIDRLQQGSHFVSYTLAAMRMLEPPASDSDGIVPTSDGGDDDGGARAVRHPANGLSGQDLASRDESVPGGDADGAEASAAVAPPVAKRARRSTRARTGS